MKTSGDDPGARSGGKGAEGLALLTGVVLCGGESRRMGRDKGLLKIGETSWAQYMAAKLAPWRLPVVYSINPGQAAAYSALIPGDQLIIDALGLHGPLEGLFSVHARLPDKDFLLLACDMPDLDMPTIQKIIEAYREKQRYDFYVYQEELPGESFIQPFCGIYTSAGLAGTFASYRGEPAGDGSLQALLRKGLTQKLSLERTEAFRNYNSL